MIKSLKKSLTHQWFWPLSTLIPLMILIVFLYLGISIRSELALLGKKPILFLIAFVSSFWIIWFLWKKLRALDPDKFYEGYKYLIIFIPMIWFVGLGLYLFTTIGFFGGYGPLTFSKKEEINLSTGFTLAHILYLFGWIVLTSWLSMSQSVMDKIENLKRPGYYSAIIVVVLCLLMILNPAKATLPITYGELSPNLILLLVEALYLLLFLMILLSLSNARKTVRLMGIISCLSIVLFALLTSVGANYITRFTYNFLFFGPTLLFAVLSVQLMAGTSLFLSLKTTSALIAENNSALISDENLRSCV